MVELLKQLTEAYGPAGREDRVREIITQALSPLNLSSRTDAMGSLIVHRPASAAGAKKIMFCAHMDEIGAIVTHIDKNGFLRFTNIGGLFPERLLHQRVLFENGRIGMIGVETKPQTPKPAGLDNLYIDIGCRDTDDARSQVKVGDIAAFHQTAVQLDRRFVAKALDDRVGCYCLIETLKRIKSSAYDLYFVFSVQEEVGLRGARTSAFSVAPDYAIAVDVTLTGDTPEAPVMDVKLGKGPAIKVKDSSFLAHPMIKEAMVSAATELGIPYQFEILEHGTTDAAVIQLINDGVISGVLSIPTRYVHSVNETCDLDDVEASIRLLTRLAEGNYLLS